jgi:phosphate transport system permease protein
MSPYDDCVRLAWAGALIITVTILLLNIFALLASLQRVQ